MPLINSSRYVAPTGLRDAHLATIWPVVFRRVDGVRYSRVRIATPDDDFLDVDRFGEGSDRVAIVSHGLEGSSEATHVRGMARALASDGWSVLAWNFRGCSGAPNRCLRSYHSGATDDLATVVEHSLRASGVRELALVGFSLGGNLTLKFLGDAGEALDPRIRRAFAVSVPCDLASSAARLAVPGNWIYMWRFLRALRTKLRAKAGRFPGRLDLRGIAAIRTFREFDERYTAPIHGFSGAEDYWRRCSCRPVLSRIRRPTLLLNARNDPFLGSACFPYAEAAASEWLALETPAHGGHVGFLMRGDRSRTWAERRAVEFLAGGD